MTETEATHEDWRAYQPLVLAKDRIEELRLELPDIEKKLEHVKGEHTRAVSALDRLRAKQIIGQATADDVQAAELWVVAAAKAEEELAAKVRATTGAMPLLAEEVKKLELEAYEAWRADLEKRYRAALANLLAGLRKLEGVNAEAWDVYTEALENFPNTFPVGNKLVPPGADVPSFAIVGLAAYLKAMAEYVGGEHGEA